MKENKEAGVNPAQERFDELYITSSEICKELDVSRNVMVDARRRGALPEPISINGRHIYIWERKTIAPYLERWRAARKAIRGAV